MAGIVERKIHLMKTTMARKFTKIMAAALAAVTMSTAASVSVSARTLTTGQKLTEQLVDEYAVIFKTMKLNPDAFVMLSNELGFFNTDVRGIICSKEEYEGANVDYWATLQKSKLCQEREGYTSILDKFSRG